MKIVNNIILLSICLIISSNLLIKTTTINELMTNKLTIFNKDNNIIKNGKITIITITDDTGNIIKIFDSSDPNEVMRLINTQNLYLQ